MYWGMPTEHMLLKFVLHNMSEVNKYTLSFLSKKDHWGNEKPHTQPQIPLILICDIQINILLTM